MHKKDRGRPTMFGKYDQKLHTYQKDLRSNGGVINTQIVIASATGILKHHDKLFLREIELSKTWAESVLHRMGFVKGLKLPDQNRKQYIDIVT